MAEELLDQLDEERETDAAEQEQSEYIGAYPEIAQRYKNGEDLSDEELDTIADVGAPIDEYEGDDGELILDVTAPDLAVLIGRHGRTLDSLQTMFSLLVSRKLGFRYPVVVDIEGYKSRRHDKIVDLAHKAASRAVRQHTTVSLQPMNAYERRLVHIALRDNVSVETHSEGIDPDRRVVITLR